MLELAGEVPARIEGWQSRPETPTCALLLLPGGMKLGEGGRKCPKVSNRHGNKYAGGPKSGHADSPGTIVSTARKKKDAKRRSSVETEPVAVTKLFFLVAAPVAWTTGVPSPPTVGEGMAGGSQMGAKVASQRLGRREQRNPDSKGE